MRDLFFYFYFRSLLVVILSCSARKAVRVSLCVCVLIVRVSKDISGPYSILPPHLFLGVFEAVCVPCTLYKLA